MTEKIIKRIDARTVTCSICRGQSKDKKRIIEDNTVICGVYFDLLDEDGGKAVGRIAFKYNCGTEFSKSHTWLKTRWDDDEVIKIRGRWKIV